MSSTVTSADSLTDWLPQSHLIGELLPEDSIRQLVLKFSGSILPECKKVLDESASPETSAYSRARSRRKIDLCEWVNQHVFDSLVSSYPIAYRGRPVFIIDGSTVLHTRFSSPGRTGCPDRRLPSGLDDDNRADLVTGGGVGGSSIVTAYAGSALGNAEPSPLFTLDAFSGDRGAVFVG